MSAELLEPERVDDSLQRLLLFLQGHSRTGEVQDHHHSLLQRSHGKTRPLPLPALLLDRSCIIQTGSAAHSEQQRPV